MISLKFPLPQKVSTNAVYSGMHWSKRKKLADLYHNYMIQFRNEKITSYPVEITYIFSFKGRLLDSLNLSFMAKLMEDGLCAHGVLVDDTPEYVSSSTLISQKGKKDEVQILIV